MKASGRSLRTPRARFGSPWRSRDDSCSDAFDDDLRGLASTPRPGVADVVERARPSPMTNHADDAPRDLMSSVIVRVHVRHDVARVPSPAHDARSPPLARGTRRGYDRSERSACPTHRTCSSLSSARSASRSGTHEDVGRHVSSPAEQRFEASVTSGTVPRRRLGRMPTFRHVDRTHGLPSRPGDLGRSLGGARRRISARADNVHARRCSPVLHT